MNEQLNKQLMEYIDKLRNADGKIDFYQLFVTFGGTDSGSIRHRMEMNYELVTDIHEKFAKWSPMLDEMNRKEVQAWHVISEAAFPYWLARDWFFALENDDATCSEQYPLYCLPVDALSWIAVWKQISASIVLIFVTLLLAAVFGRGRNLPSSWLLLFTCFLIDSLGALSLLLPVVGNLLDVFWAPFAGMLIGFLFKSWKMGLVYFFKEVLIVTDVIPLATMWALAA